MLGGRGDAASNVSRRRRGFDRGLLVARGDAAASTPLLAQAYCATSCTDYCSQDDRKDGLSGSVSSEGGEVGWSSYSRGGNTVEYGADRPPDVSILPKGLLPGAGGGQ